MTSLMPEWTLGALSLTDYPYSVVMDSFDPGQPSLEGEPREMSIKVGIEGADLLELAESEAALRREINKDLNEFGHNPGDGFAPASVFETTSITAKPIRYENGGEQSCYREWELSIEAESYARSASPTIAEPLSAGGSPSVTMFDACDTNTGWTGAVDGTPADATTFYEAGTVGVAVFDDNPDADIDTIVMRRTDVVDFTGTPYLIVDARTTSASSNLIVREDGVALPLVSLRDLGGDRGEYTFLTSGSASSALEFEHARSATDTAWLGLFIYDLTRSNMPPGATSKQLSRIIPIGGTERTPGSIHVAAPDGTSALGLAIVSTYPARYCDAGFDPAMSRWYTSGTRTADATTVSGYRFRVDDAYFTSEIPSSSMPDGGYQMVSLMRMSVTGTYRVESVVQTKKDGVTLAEWTNVETLWVPDDWYLVDMGVPSLPILRAHSGTTTVLAVRVTNVDGTNLVGVTAEVQDSWFFPVDEDCGLTALLTPRPHLWLDSPTIVTGAPRIYEGSSPDRAGSTFPINGVHTFGLHTLTAGHVGMTAIATGVEYAETDVTYYKRWLHNAAEDG